MTDTAETAADADDADPPPGPADLLEEQLRALSAELVDPGETECLLCFLRRVVADVGCDTTVRWGQRYRDLRVPAATGL